MLSLFWYLCFAASGGFTYSGGGLPKRWVICSEMDCLANVGRREMMREYDDEMARDYAA